MRAKRRKQKEMTNVNKINTRDLQRRYKWCVKGDSYLLVTRFRRSSLKLIFKQNEVA